MRITGAKGNRDMEVSDAGRALTESVTESDMEHQNEQGVVWALPFDAVDPTAANDMFVYMKNEESLSTIHLRRIHVSSTVAGMLEVIAVTGTAVGGSEATLTNFNQGFSSKTPSGKFQTGSDITGLADTGKYAFQQLKNADQTYEITFHHDIILDKNGAIALNWVPATGILSGTLFFMLHE